MAKDVAVVVGGAGGIGAACVIRLAADYQPVVFDLVTGRSRRAKVYQLDIRDAAAVKEAVSEVQRTCGPVTAVVFAASGVLEHVRLVASRWRSYEEHVSVQVSGLLNVVQALAPRAAQRQRTRFVIILSEHCLGKPASGFAPYVVGKYALLGMARAMAVELAPFGFTVNMVSPGLTRTPLIEGLPRKLLEMASATNPRGRLAEATDVASVVSWLASDEADYLNGVNIPVTGGQVFS